MMTTQIVDIVVSGPPDKPPAEFAGSNSRFDATSRGGVDFDRHSRGPE